MTEEANKTPEATPAPKKPAAKKADPGPPPPRLIVSSTPHIRSGHTIEAIMYLVILALLPALAGSVVFFGMDAVRVILWTVAGCFLFEMVCLLLVGKTNLKRSLLNGSALLTGLLLAMNLPSSAPWWLCLLGAFVAMVIGKHVFGGLGTNPFNPALVARVFLIVSAPAAMTNWPIPRFATDTLKANIDGITAATPLGILKTNGVEAMQAQFSNMDLLMGNIGGCLGETSALLLLLGGIFLIVKKIIRWETPVAFIGTLVVLSGIAWFFDDGHDRVADPLFQVLSGGVILGAFFMATDYVTTPMSIKGMFVFGAGCGLLTFVIRTFGSFPEGVSFAIVLMNALVPLIDRYCVPKGFGLCKPEPKKA